MRLTFESRPSKTGSLPPRGWASSNQLKALGAQSEVSGNGRNFPQDCNLETLPEFPAFRLKTAASTLARASPSNPARAVSCGPCVSANPDDYTWRLVRPSPREPSRREQEGTRSGSARCCTAFRFRAPLPIDRSIWNPGVGRFRNPSPFSPDPPFPSKSTFRKGHFASTQQAFTVRGASAKKTRPCPCARLLRWGEVSTSNETHYNAQMRDAVLETGKYNGETVTRAGR